MKKNLHLAQTSLLFALCIVLNFAESTLIPLSVYPGIKIGLSNLPVMFSLLCLTPSVTLSLVVSKSVFAFITRGVSAGLLSFFGGIMSVSVMYIIKKCFKGNVSLVCTSVFGAVFHNIGQLIGVAFLWGSFGVFSLSPILLISGIVFGILNALLVKYTLPYFEKIGG